jgi:hypothetical protein
MHLFLSMHLLPALLPLLTHAQLTHALEGGGQWTQAETKLTST